jgi:quercetin dioxygenase-like cupin family protein
MPFRRLVALLVFAASSTALTACATTAAAAAGSSLPALAAVALDWPSGGKPLAHVEVFQNREVKVVLISLKAESQMPEHASPFPVWLTASSGRGTVKTLGASYPLDPGHAVFLPGGEKHSVTADHGEGLHISVLALKSQGPAPVEHQGH